MFLFFRMNTIFVISYHFTMDNIIFALQFLIISRLNLDVYFDDDMVQIYGGNVAKTKAKVQKVMTYVEEIYEERDTLQTKIKMNVNIEHKKGQKWGLMMA